MTLAQPDLLSRMPFNDVRVEPSGFFSVNDNVSENTAEAESDSGANMATHADAESTTFSFSETLDLISKSVIRRVYDSRRMGFHGPIVINLGPVGRGYYSGELYTTNENQQNVCSPQSQP